MFFWFRVGIPRPVWVSQQHGVSCLFTSPPICQYIQMWLEIMLPGASLWWFRKVYPIQKKNVLRVFDLHTHCWKVIYGYAWNILCLLHIYLYILPRPPDENPFSNGFIFLDNSLCVRWLLAFLIRQSTLSCPVWPYNPQDQERAVLHIGILWKAIYDLEITQNFCLLFCRFDDEFSPIRYEITISSLQIQNKHDTSCHMNPHEREMM